MKAALVKNNYHLTGKIPEKCLDYHAYKNSFVEYRKKLYYESSEDNPQNVDEGMEGFSEHISRLCYDHYLLYNNSEHGITKEQQALVLWSKVYTSFVGDFEKVIFIKGPLDQELEWTIETMKKITLLFLNIHFLQSLCTNKGADFYKENNSIYLVNTPDTKDFYIINETETFIIENHQRKIFKTTRQENYSQRLKNLFCHICCESQKKHLTGCKKKGNDILYHPRKRNLFFYSKEFFPENDHEEKKVLVEYFTSLLKTVVLDSYF